MTMKPFCLGTSPSAHREPRTVHIPQTAQGRGLLTAYEQPYEFNHVFRRLLQELGIEKSPAGTNRTLYSLRHTYATLELLAGTDIHTLAKQMGTSVVMLERHYSKLTATLAAEQLA